MYILECIYYKRWVGTDGTRIIFTILTFTSEYLAHMKKKHGVVLPENSGWTLETISVRKNINTHTCFKYEYNYFVARSCFMLGQRKVHPGTVHLYDISTIQMVFYYGV